MKRESCKICKAYGSDRAFEAYCNRTDCPKLVTAPSDGLPPLPEDSPDYNDLGRALMWEEYAMKCRDALAAALERVAELEDNFPFDCEKEVARWRLALGAALEREKALRETLRSVRTELVIASHASRRQAMTREELAKVGEWHAKEATRWPSSRATQYFHEQCARFIAEAAAALSGVPQGYVMVPVEPTEEMLKAVRGEGGDHITDALSRSLWKAMLQAHSAPASNAGDKQD